jgi:hypothetical protein
MELVRSSDHCRHNRRTPFRENNTGRSQLPNEKTHFNGLTSTMAPRTVEFSKSAAASEISDMLLTLPDELLLNIAGRLETPDLVSLSRVSQHVGPIAQEELHRCVTIPFVQGNRVRTRIAKLTETLTQRPDLACIAQQLTVIPQAKLVLVDSSILSVSKQSAASPAVLNHRDWGMHEHEVAGYLLHKLPNLKDLWVSSMSGNRSDTMEGLDPRAFRGNV